MNRATRTVVSAMGVIMGLAGIEHGVGETLQGSTAPDGLVIESWPGSEFFRIVAGEPAMTIIPNLFITGILAILVSLIFLAWATLFIGRKHGGLVLILLSIVMLLVGGGFGPPIIGTIIGAVATRINAPLTWWRGRVAVGLRRFLGGFRLWALIACLISWLLMFPGTSILGYFFTLNGPSLIPVLFLCALGFLLLAILTALANDSLQQESGVERS